MEFGFDEQEPSPSPAWVTELLTAAAEDGAELNKPSRALATISRAPESMRRAMYHNDTTRRVPVYEPELVSIGPFHRENPSVQSMEDHKRRFLIARGDRLCGASRRSAFLARLAAAMKALEARARECYSEAFEDVMSSDEFVSMMVLDGCFVLELFRISLRLENFVLPLQDEDPLLRMPWMRSALAFDLLKLENQLPYFVLEELYMLTKSGDDEPCLMRIAQKFLYRFCRTKMRDNEGMVLFYRDLGHLEPDHLLSLVYYMFMPTNTTSITGFDDTEERSSYFPPTLPSVNGLLLSGIKIEKGEDGRPLDIKYSRSTLAIPHLIVTKSINILMGNLIAYEQCNPGVPPYYTFYVTFLDGIVNSKKDIKALRMAGVLDHFLGTDGEAIELLNTLASGIDYFDMRRSYLFDVAAEIRKHWDRPWTRWKVRVRRLVASREGLTRVVTVFALYLAFLQTVFTVLSYVRTFS